MSDYPMLISNKLHSFRNFMLQSYIFLQYHSTDLVKLCNGQYVFQPILPYYRPISGLSQGSRSDITVRCHVR